MIFVIGLWTFLRALFLEPAAVALENLTLRHQLLVLQRYVPRPRLSRWDRILWFWLSRLWPGWRLNLIIVQPATVLAWHRQGFQLYWRWRSAANRGGRPRLDAEIRRLIRHLARENPTWGRRRIQAELALLGYEVAELTVAKYMHRTSLDPRPRGGSFSPLMPECLDHFVILNEADLRRLLRGYIGYYNTARPHQSLDNNSPQPRVVEPPPCGRIVAIPQVGGLHHRYQRVA